MKKFLIFVAGMVTGAVLIIIVSMFLAGGGNSSNGIVLFEQPGDCVGTNDFEVMQVLDSGDALAREFEDGLAIGKTVLFLAEDGVSYYDDQVIEIPKGKCAKQVGTFKYTTNGGMDKTVPIVSILDK